MREKYHDTLWDFNNEYRPYHLRKHGVYGLSKVPLDDLDLPRPMSNGQRVKAYYAYDVLSSTVVGMVYNRLKTHDLFLDCMRNTFQMLDRNGFYMPAELEMEHHLVKDFADGLMKAGEGLRGEAFHGVTLRETAISHNHEDILESIDTYDVRYLAHVEPT